MAAGSHFGCSKSLCITFLTISDQYHNFYFVNFFYKMAAVGHFGCPKFTLDHISGYFRSIQIFYFFLDFVQNGCRWPFWMSENHFRSHFHPFFPSMPNFIFFWNFDKMADVGHFGCANFSFDRTSGHFRSMRNFNFLQIFDKMADVGHFGCPKFTFDRISGHFRSICNFNFFLNFWQNGCRRPFWMSEIHFRSQFWPFQIDTEFVFSAAAILDGTTMSIIELVRDIWMSNACVKFEERSLNPSQVIALTRLCGGSGGGGCVADENIIFPKTYVSREYNYQHS